MKHKGFLLLVLLLAALWWLLTSGAPSSWVIGAPVVLLAAWSVQSRKTQAGNRFSLRGLMLFLPFFAWESIVGGIDVARRVLAPSPAIEPGYLDYQMRLSDIRAQMLFVNTVSLLPGTLAADLDGSTVRVHALDVRENVHAELQKLERVVAKIYPGEGLA